MITTILTDEQIAQALNLAVVNDYADVPLSYDLEIARVIEQAVLNSPEVVAMRWISVEDRLPPADDTEVIALHGGTETEIVWGWLIHETHPDRAYSHWMSLPTPPANAAMEKKP